MGIWESAMESLGMTAGLSQAQFWQDKKVFLTGHTGFKGGWLALWLNSMGAQVHGYALSPSTTPSFFNVANVESILVSNTIADIRDAVTLERAMTKAQPDIVFHLAAQPLVRQSYIDPVETFTTNVIGTVNLLEAVRRTTSICAVVNVTTDKCYENKETLTPYSEDAPMGGFDPYSSSKGCSELVTSSYRQSFLAEKGIALASARAGNVIGGGDWSVDRLIPDFLQALDKKEELRIYRTLDDIDFENTFFTHHYYSAKHLFSDWDYQLGALSIFKQIKRKCEQEKMNLDTLEEFIKNYIKDFYNFSKAYSELFDKIARDDNYSKLFQFLEFTATLYPLIVRLNEQGKLDGLLSILELAEVRVYKLKNTNPRRNMYLLASEVNETDFSEKEIEEKIREFATNFLNDYQLESYMNEGVDNKTALYRYLLYDYNKSNNNQDLSLNDYRNLQVEHIFSVNPNFNTETYGFERVEIYSKKISLIGNLSILEKGLNSKVGNICPTDKVSGYQESKLQINSHLMANLDKFNQEYIEKRNLKLVEYTKTRFNLN